MREGHEAGRIKNLTCLPAQAAAREGGSDLHLLTLWLLLAGPLWGGVGAVVLPRRYRRRGLDSQAAGLRGGTLCAALGLPALVYLWLYTPPLRRLHGVVAATLLAAELFGLFASVYPGNPCVTSAGYVANQAQNGLVLGAVYATMAAGLTLIYSVQRIISFTHGQFVMFGGVMAYLLLTRGLDVNPLFAVPIVGVASFILGAIIERVLLTPIHRSGIERPGEYAILITFGLGMFLQYALVGLLGSPTGIRAPRYTDMPPLIGVQPMFEMGALRLRTDNLIAGVLGLLMFAALAWFLRTTWPGKSLRAVAANQTAAEVTGVDSGAAHNLAFAAGSMLAGMSGAILVPVMNMPIPEMASLASVRSYVSIVLGGLGSVPGAFLGGLSVGLAESLTAACFPDPSRGATYQLAAGLLIFALVLLLRPQGLMGRKP